MKRVLAIRKGYAVVYPETLVGQNFSTHFGGCFVGNIFFVVVYGGGGSYLLLANVRRVTETIVRRV